MKSLHILTKPIDDLTALVIDLQRAQKEAEVLVVDLTAPRPDYADLIGKVFESDSVAVW